MTLYEICQAMQEIAMEQPNINYTGVGDIYDLNDTPNLKYGVFFITQSSHIIGEDTTQFQLTLYYVDRLFQDKSNTLQIQSVGIQLLNNIINQFNYEYSNVNVEFDVNCTTFTHKFSDYCAGVFAQVTVEVDNNLGICGGY